MKCINFIHAFAPLHFTYLCFGLTSLIYADIPSYLAMGNDQLKLETTETSAVKEKRPNPWLTGPLLTSSGTVVPNGHYNIEPYFYATNNYAAYNPEWQAKNKPNLYNLISATIIQIGMPAHLDFTFTPQFSWNYTHGAADWVLNDMTFGFDYQILRSRGHWWPSIKLQLRGNFPFGKYYNLDAKKLGTDSGGSGSWDPALGLVFSRLFWFGGHQFLALRFGTQYTFPTPVQVKNLNVYGGGNHTRGRVLPGQNLQTLIGMEYTWTQRWAFACDFEYVHTNRTRFKGRLGKTNGVRNSMGSPSSEQFSIAPAFEYNWSDYVGIIAGVWFTLAGRNATDFVSGVVAVNIYK